MCLFKSSRDSVWIVSLRKRTSISQDISAMSSVLNEKDIYINICNHTKAEHHQCANAISLPMWKWYKWRKESQRIGPSLPKHMSSGTAIATGLVLPLSSSGSRCSLKLSVASPIDGNGVKHNNLADFCLKPHGPSTISLQKHRNEPQSVSYSE